MWSTTRQVETVTPRTLFGVKPRPRPWTPATTTARTNIGVSAHGGVILAAGGEGINHLIGVTAASEPFPIIGGNELNDSEFCGPALSAGEQRWSSASSLRG